MNCLQQCEAKKVLGKKKTKCATVNHSKNHSVSKEEICVSARNGMTLSPFAKSDTEFTELLFLTKPVINKKKWSELAKKMGVIFHQENVKSSIYEDLAETGTDWLGYILNPLYSSDLVLFILIPTKFSS